MQGKSFPSPILISPPSSGAENPIQPFISHRDNHTCVVKHLVKRHKYIFSDGGTRHTYIRITQSNLSFASEPQALVF